MSLAVDERARAGLASTRRGPDGAPPVRALTYFIFLMFAMTTDSVGVIIPEVIKQFGLGATAGGAFQYASSIGVALGGLGLGFVADRLGRKGAILLGLSVFALSAVMFGVNRSFGVFCALMFVTGMSIGVFKTGALALIGDLSRSPRAHTTTMNMVEGFFAVGAVIGPALVTLLLAQGFSWKWLYVMAGCLCLVLILASALAPFPARPKAAAGAPVDLKRTLAIAANPWALGFGVVIMLYVGVEAAVTVWMPTLLGAYKGSAVLLAAYALSIFYILRAVGRFAGSWLLGRWPWTRMLAVCSFAIFVCFALAMIGGRATAVYALPASGLFMSVLYPTLNSKGISCFPRSEHGAVSGVLLFFTCLSGVASPLAMGLISDRLGDMNSGFGLASVLAAFLFLALAANWILDPAGRALSGRAEADYAGDGEAPAKVPSK